ncbi:MAG: hypothetical protein UY12_C0010G0012 [Parcubacteria group bacterium GW2011_GWA2_47_8b]|uniref:Uncharacterized protein n=2 Tax=Parcubacteria group TaxID=1794811 RepID=A0A1G1ZMT4_9BACT|nr:MAG: hypothetical protein UY12_C0010G0012 [Parcubacteria group bacterium GW2011_GWA2_47_8b]OGY65070.1 MAG: hypothetical protein A3E64_02205 [Candidatus Harrisonbacteria bacterium RIFCSPHIGHO2_12_FULL_48_16]
MGAIKMLIALVVMLAVAGIVFYFAPDNIKEQGLAYISGIPFLPAEVKKAAEDIFATPEYKRGKLLQELETNLGTIQKTVEENVSAPTQAVKAIERTKEIVEEITKLNDDPTFIKQITNAVTEKLVDSGKACPTTGN